ncbi:hypothetical protein COLO4_12062 [Corchorus olitorius]|uniref:RNase H type-1 domain-containing protein n=1 Tax=Corchorus olitorius TaxID=93759 RepID=A0A1R3K2A5_9ROSI|nr:hypothetical protein COLO4_12062 [Corchorus olitorius]
MDSYLKVNTDAAYNSSQKSAKLGIVIRNSTGEIISSAFKQINYVADVLHAERRWHQHKSQSDYWPIGAPGKEIQTDYETNKINRGVDRAKSKNKIGKNLVGRAGNREGTSDV